MSFKHVASSLGTLGQKMRRAKTKAQRSFAGLRRHMHRSPRPPDSSTSSSGSENNVHNIDRYITTSVYHPPIRRQASENLRQQYLNDELYMHNGHPTQHNGRASSNVLPTNVLSCEPSVPWYLNPAVPWYLRPSTSKYYCSFTPPHLQCRPADTYQNGEYAWHWDT